MIFWKLQNYQTVGTYSTMQKLKYQIITILFVLAMLSTKNYFTRQIKQKAKVL